MSSDDIEDGVVWEDCERCGGDGAVEYEGHPLDDYIDADPKRVVTCPDCKGHGVVPGTVAP